MEVVYDLDTEIAELCRELGVNLFRAATVGVHPTFISMIRELILERTEGVPRRAAGRMGAACDFCADDCCASPRRPN
jgi:ferrochelatase